jgi:endonuclease-3
MKNKTFPQTVTDGLKFIYPEAKCALDYEKPYELIIAGRLSAQCTDKRVNEVTKLLFIKYRDIKSLADANLPDVEDIIKPCGLYHAKARDIIGICKKIYYEYKNTIPNTIEELTKLPGIGRKTANLIMGDIHHMPAYVCDTHCIRISGRLRFTDSASPVRVEADLRRVIAPDESSDFCHRIVFFGRDFCTARNPKCSTCPLIKTLHEDYPEFKCKVALQTTNGNPR